MGLGGSDSLSSPIIHRVQGHGAPGVSAFTVPLCRSGDVLAKGQLGSTVP